MLSVLVGGPYLARSATRDSESRSLDLHGDLDQETTLTVFGPESLCSIKWNGEKVKIESKEGLKYTALLEGPPDFELPKLGSWRYEDSLPEISNDYEASSSVWVGK